VPRPLAERWDFDFPIRLELADCLIDVFDTTIDNADVAYITTQTFETWDQVERFCRDYDGISVL